MAQSARGLFKAMGHSARKNDDTSEEERDVRDPLDYRPTPPAPFLALARAERAALKRFPVLWENAAGDGRMMRQMAAAGFGVVGSDLVDRDANMGVIIRSFYDFKEPLAPAIVTNPPFQECNGRDGKGRWIRHAMEIGVEYMALLLSWSWPAANALGTLWDEYPPARAYLMRWKIDFTGEGAPPMNCGWFVWDREHQGETLLRMLDRVDHRQPSLLEEELT